MTIQQAVDLVLLDIRENQSKTSQYTYAWHGRNAIEVWGADTVLMDITRKQLQEWATKRKQSVSPATLRAELSFFNRLCIAADEAGFEVSFPAKRLRLPAVNNWRRRVLLPVEEALLRRVMTVAQWSCVEFAIQTGIRRLEQWSLRSIDVRTFDRPVTVKGKQQMVRAGIAHIRKSKTGKGREIPLNPRAAAVVDYWLPRGTEFLFAPDKGDRLAAAVWYAEHVWRKAVKKAGIVDLHWHDLRHSFATRAVAAGARREQVGKVLGHSGPQMTERYITWAPDMLWPAVMAASNHPD